MITTPQLRAAMNAIEEKKGAFALFGIFMRADGPGAWDLVISAPWLEVGKLKALGELLRLLEQHLGEREVRRFAKIVTLKGSSADIRAELEKLDVGATEKHFFNTTLFGADVQEAIILRAKPVAVRSELSRRRGRKGEARPRRQTRRRGIATALRS